jgi:hypothetical protein
MLGGEDVKTASDKSRRDRVKIKQQEAIELYGTLKQQGATALSTYHSHIQHYRVLIAAILGASFATIIAVLKLAPQDLRLTGWLMLGTLILPVTNALLCFLAIKQCDHPYRMFLETITVQARLEEIIGLAELVPERWHEPTRHSTSKEFVDKYIRKGTNRLARRLFALLAVANIILTIAAGVGACVFLANACA